MHFGTLGGWEWLIIFGIIIILFGIGKLPKAVADLGKSMREFRRAISEEAEDEKT